MTPERLEGPVPLLEDRSRRDVENDRIVLEGRIALDRALAAGAPVEVVVTNATQLETLQVPRDTRVFVTDRWGFEALMGYPFHRGIVGVLRRSRWRPELPNWGSGRVFVPALCRLADPVNVGAILRSAAAFGASAVVVDRAGADPYSRRAMRASMGAAFTLPVWLSDPSDALAELRRARADVRVLAASPRGEVRIDEVRPSDCDVVLFGHEGDGLDEAALAQADVRVSIPIDPRVDSLNVGASAAILLHALRAR